MRRPSIRLLAYATTTLAFGAANAAQLPIVDFVKYPPLTHPVISPDGRYLAVTVGENGGSGKASYQLAVLQLPGLQPVSRLTMAPRYMPADVAWTSDTRLVMSLRFDTGPLDIPSPIGDVVAVNYDGSHERTLYTLRKHGNVPATGSMGLPPGFATIEPLSRQADGHFALNLQLVPERSGDTPWDSGKSVLYDVDSGSGRATEIGAIAHGGMTLIPYHGVARIAAGSNDRFQTEAFASTDGNTWTRIRDADVGAVFRPLRIGDDGKVVYALSSMHGGPNQLVQCNLDGSQRKVLAADPFSSVTTVMWNPITHAPLAAVFAGGGRPRVQYLGNDRDSQILQALAHGDPGDFVGLAGASRDGGQLLIHVASDRDPGSYALFDTRTLKAQPLFQMLPWIQPNAMPQRLPIRFANRSGTELAGYLTLPVGGDEKHLPLVLIPHGGPLDVSDSWFFDPWAAFLANRGYAVLQINYRGSGQRGTHFLDAGFRQFGSGIQDDLIDGVKWAIAQGYADPARICVFGGSFGGYSALMQPILAPKLYQCAIDYAGVYDWRIEFKRSDIHGSANGRNYLQMAVGSLQDAGAISPSGMLGRFNVPVLIAHGKDDPRVPFQNAVELRAALEAAHKPFAWLAEPDELHGFRGVDHNQALFSMIQSFLARYIGAGASQPTTAAK